MSKGSRWRRDRSRRRSAVGRVAILALLGVASILIAWSVGFRVLVDATLVPDSEFDSSTLVLDRQGRLLRAFTVADGRWRLRVSAEEVDPLYVEMLLAYEDRRFFDHAGVDLRALLRAGMQYLSNGRTVSGGSTISMQLVRLLGRRPTRDLAGKFRQILAALALERKLDKQAILTTYLNLAPYGGNIEGVRAAALAWFGREPSRLTPAESALLVALPQSPEARRPDRNPRYARQARDRVLTRALSSGIIDQDTAEAARLEPVPETRRPFPLLAAHAARRALRSSPARKVHRLTIDAALQERLERLALERARSLGKHISVALMLTDHRDGRVLGSVGSAGLLEEARDGFVDMTRAVRSPGSTLKPLIYGLAFEAGIAHPESLIEDRPTGFSGYVPANFTREFQGTVTVRRALQLSLNVPAVKLLHGVGTARLIARMRRAGAQPSLSDVSPPGLAIGLGGVGIRLEDLVGIYAAIARGGRRVELRERADAARGQNPGRRVLDERAAWYVASILSGARDPMGVSPGGLAFKTGTSYGYRDAWAIGFDGRYVAGVWAGRPDGAPVPGLTGIRSAVPILIDLFALVGGRVPLPGPPPGVLSSTSADLPPPLRNVGGESGAGPEIAFPPQGARLAFQQGDTGVLVLKVRAGSPPFTWFADGKPVAREPFSRTAVWRPQGPGFSTISVVDGRGRASRVRVVLESTN